MGDGVERCPGGTSAIALSRAICRAMPPSYVHGLTWLELLAHLGKLRKFGKWTRTKLETMITVDVHQQAVRRYLSVPIEPPLQEIGLFDCDREPRHPCRRQVDWPLRPCRWGARHASVDALHERLARNHRQQQ